MTTADGLVIVVVEENALGGVAHQRVRKKLTQIKESIKKQKQQQKIVKVITLNIQKQMGIYKGVIQIIL